MRNWFDDDRFARGPLSSPWTRLGVLASFLSMLFLIVLLELPVGGTFPERLGGEAPRAGSAPRCLRLAYDPASDSDWMPVVVRVRPNRAPTYDVQQTWYEADEIRASGFHRRLAWRPAGRDSVDIVWHHSPVLRIPARGASRVGRGGLSQHVSIFSLVTNQDVVVRAREFACGAENWAGG